MREIDADPGVQRYRGARTITEEQTRDFLLREAALVAGEWRDQLLYAILDREWSAQPERGSL